MKTAARLIVILFLFSFSFINSVAQATPTSALQDDPPTGQARTSADETFELNIAQRRITRVDFEASTSLQTEGNANVNVQIGVGLAAGKIDVLLRNVQGRVRFRGSLERILELLTNRRAAAPLAP